MAGIYNGHLLEFPQIRVDCFTAPTPSRPHLLPLSHASFSSSRLDSGDSTTASSSSLTYSAPPAQLYLLTHVHSDHLLGLSDSFTGKIVCSPDTKRMLLRLEAEQSRQHHVEGTKEVIKRKYEGLRARVVGKGTRDERVVDHIETLPYGYPKEYDLGFDDDGHPTRVTVTLLDANHCPGSTMFLITSPDKAVLHTGDIRCDKLFLQSLKRNPAIQQYLAPASSFSVPNTEKYVKREVEAALPGGKGKAQLGARSGRRVLDRIYLDTSAVLGTGDMPDKEEALQDLLQQMSLYPPDTIFFLNVWCFGWEDVIKEVARYFDAQVHVDRYKFSIFAAVRSDPFLSACTTLDPTATRFHACERRWKCDACRTFNRDGQRVWNTDKRVVHVNMVEVKSASWVLERQAFLVGLGRAALGEGPWPYNILCPIARHSPLPELQALVKLFRPHAISPNTVVPQAQGLDYFLLPDFLADHVQPGAYDGMIRERDRYFDSRFGPEYVHRLKSLQSAGVSLTSILEEAPGGLLEKMELLPDSSALPLPDDAGGASGSGSTSAMLRGRRAHAADQLHRAGGIPLHSMAELRSVLGGQAEQQLVKVFGQQGMAAWENGHARVYAVPGVPSGGAEELKGFGLGAGAPNHYDGCDTDEEESQKRKRRRRAGVVSAPSESADSDELHRIKVEAQGSPDQRALQTARAHSSHNTEKRVNPSESTGSCRSPTPHEKRPTPRFSVDKNHLRALAMVGGVMEE